MWKAYTWAAGVAITTALTAVGVMTPNLPVAHALFIAAGAIFLSAQAIPVYALLRQRRKNRDARNEVLTAFALDLERVAGIANAAAMRYENDPFPHQVESDYVTKYRPLFQEAYRKAVALRRRSTDTELEVAICASVSAEGLRDISARFMALARRMQAIGSS
jgi:hypothetical protein